MQFVCRYGVDPAHPLDGIIIADLVDGAVVDMGNPAFANCVVVPSDQPLESYPKVGPEPPLLGDPPTELRPDADELIAAGIGKYVLGDDGEPLRDKDGHKVVHALHLVAGTPYPDNRHLAPDYRPRAAPSQALSNVQRAYLGRVRWVKEIGGVTVDGFPAYTSRETRGQTEADASRAARDPRFSKQVKGTDGTFYDLDAEKLIKVADAVSDHVQACFDTEAKLLIDIEAGELSDFGPIDKAFAKL